VGHVMAPIRRGSSIHLEGRVSDGRTVSRDFTITAAEVQAGLRRVIEAKLPER